MKELLVKDLLPELEQATDVRKRVEEVRAKPAPKQNMNLEPGEIRASNPRQDLSDAIAYYRQLELTQRQAYELERMRQMQQEQLLRQRPFGPFDRF